MLLENQKEIAEIQNESHIVFDVFQSANSRKNSKYQVYSQYEMLAYHQKEYSDVVWSIMENCNVSKQLLVSESMSHMLTIAESAGLYFTYYQI